MDINAVTTRRPSSPKSLKSLEEYTIPTYDIKIPMIMPTKTKEASKNYLPPKQEA